mgnify:CR=1 FL=1
MKLAMRVVKIQRQHIICSSPGDQTSIPIPEGEITNEGNVW